MNITVISGNVGRDAELRYTPSGVAVADFSVATNRVWTDRNTNERREKTTWFKVTVWGARAESLAPHIKKGNRITVSGEIDCSAYQNQGGEARATLELRADQITFGGGNNTTSEPQPEEDLPF
jgi:single-strand DNA-binding protein